MPDPVPNPTGRAIFFYSPHQDDETLFMGQVIAHHALAGREVHVVLMTNGSTSAVLPMLNGGANSGWWGGFHYPEREGYDPLSQPDFGLARDREFIAAVGQLGVFPENIHFATGRPNNTTMVGVEEEMRKWATLYPDAGHYTMHWSDPNSDHGECGLVLKNLHLSGDPLLTDVRWLTKPEQAAGLGAFTYNPPPVHLPEIKRMTRRATFAYRAWGPPHAYAIGYHSVGLGYFDDVERGDPNFMVKL
jgi:LmbE family N-acetylglucosaminyl deacetylase